MIVIVCSRRCKTKVFGGIYWNQRVHQCVRSSMCPSVCVSFCIQNSSFCQTASAGIKSHLVTSLVKLAFVDEDKSNMEQIEKKSIAMIKIIRINEIKFPFL